MSARGAREDQVMKVAAYQAPYLPFGSFDAVTLIRDQLDKCETAEVEVLCCPEAVLGGLALEGAGQRPGDVALAVANGELAEVLGPLLESPVTVIIGFTERDPGGRLYSSAALLSAGVVAAVYRKVYPGYRTVISAGAELPVFRHGATPYGVMICNDIWYAEPARLLANSGAAVIFVPTNSGHLREPSTSFRARGDNLPIARAVENTTTVVVADIAGHQEDVLAYGFSAVVDPDGIVLAKAEPMTECLLISDIESDRRPFNPRGLDGHTNPDVAKAYLELWSQPQQ